MTIKASVAPPAVLSLARQCDSLIGVLRDELTSSTLEPREIELIGLADDLAARLFKAFWDAPRGAFRGADEHDFAGIAGRLSAVTTAMRAAACATADGEGALMTRGDRVGWLTWLAADLASDLARKFERSALVAVA